MEEMKRVRTGRCKMEELAETVDEVTGGQRVADTFAKTYRELYNSAGSEEEMESLKKRIKSVIQQESCKSATGAGGGEGGGASPSK